MGEMRRNATKCFKIGILAIFLGFLVLEFLGTSSSRYESLLPVNNSIVNRPFNGGLSEDHHFGLYSLSGERVNRIPNITLDDKGILNQKNISDILNRIRQVNSEQVVRNMDLFGSTFNNETVVVMVQVHDRAHYLRELIGSLSRATDIEKTLIIFSHDVFDEEINDIIDSIDFARTLQIFYPYSIQTHPNEFPGESPGDCPRNVKKDKALKLKCANAQWPDIYGHYREAKFTQTKHHWWWKANQVFDELTVTKYHDGLIVFIEEDHYVSKDFLPTLKLMYSQKNDLCEKCQIMCLGTYLRVFNYEKDGSQVELNEWVSAKHNMGLVMTRDLWINIKTCRSNFCEFDDYNWDWSLQHVSVSCLKDKLQVMLLKGPRIFHIGECGVHHKKNDCETADVIKKVESILSKASSYLYPRELKAVNGERKHKKKYPDGNGGWGDKRDQELCMNLVQEESQRNSTA